MPKGGGEPPLVSALMRWLFPLMIVSFALGQYRPVTVLILASKTMSLLTLAAAVTVVLLTLPDSAWPAMLVGLLMILRGWRYAVVDSWRLDLAYTVGGAILFSAAGALVAARRPGVVQRQFVVFCALSIPIMVLQMLGVEWSQYLRTDMHNPEFGRTQFPTFLVPAGQQVLTTFQLRPAGFLSANNAAALVGSFGLALYFGRLDRDHRFSGRDVVLLGMLVLLMAKQTYVILLLAWTWRMTMGPLARRHVIVSAGVMAVLLAAYRVAFPGLFAGNLSPTAFITDVQIRVADLLLATGVPMLAALANRIPSETLKAFDPSSPEGAFTTALRAPTLAPLLVLAVPLIWFALKAWWCFESTLRREIAAVAIVAVLVSLTSSFLGAFIFWFLAGSATLPFWHLVDGEILHPARERRI